MNFSKQTPGLPRLIKGLLQGGKVLPRWSRLLADLSILCVAFFQTYLLLETLVFHRSPGKAFFPDMFLFTCISVLLIYISRLHTGLLRYSNAQDIARIFSCLICINCSYYMLSKTLLPVLGYPGYPALELLLPLSFLISFFALIMLRVGSRMVFNAIWQGGIPGRRKHVLIYGSDESALLVKQGLERNTRCGYNVIGFVDGLPERWHRRMERRRVYALSDIPRLSQRWKVEEMLVLNDGGQESGKHDAWELCLQAGIRVVMVPPVETWLAGKMDRTQLRDLQIEDLLQRDPIQIDQQSVQQELSGRRILITGAAGSIGSELVRKILAYQPALLVLLDQAESPLHELELEVRERAPGVLTEIVLCDIRNRERLESLFDIFRPELVFHAAAYKHVPMMERSPLEAVSVNAEGTRNLADLARAYKTGSFVMISTDKAVNPTNVMGASKRLAEMYIQALDKESEHTRFITTRFGNVLGSNGSVIPTFHKQIKKGGPVTVTHPNITRYFMTISEAVELVLQAGTMGKGGELFVFDMGESVKITDLARKMIQLAGLEEGRDISIVYTGLRPGEKLYEELLTASEAVLPTYHEKIHIARVREVDYAGFVHNFNRLVSCRRRQQVSEMVALIKQMVPEFISRNSPFQQLDLKDQEIPQSLPQV